jgi:hypothetical protein
LTVSPNILAVVIRSPTHVLEKHLKLGCGSFLPKEEIKRYVKIISMWTDNGSKWVYSTTYRCRLLSDFIFANCRDEGNVITDIMYK